MDKHLNDYLSRMSVLKTLLPHYFVNPYPQRPFFAVECDKSNSLSATEIVPLCETKYLEGNLLPPAFRVLNRVMPLDDSDPISRLRRSRHKVVEWLCAYFGLNEDMTALIPVEVDDGSKRFRPWISPINTFVHVVEIVEMY